MKTSKTDRLNKAYQELVGRGLLNSRKEFAEKIGFNYSGVVSALTGNRPATIQMLTAIGYRWSFFNREWLKTGIGSITIDEKPLSVQTLDESIIVPRSDYMIVEVRDIDESPPRFEVDASLLPKSKTRVIPKEKESGQYIITKIEGDRMDDGSSRSLCDGDELLVKRYLGGYTTMPIRSKLFIVCATSGNVVTQIAKVDNETKDITCRSFNKLYLDYIIETKDIIEIFTVERKLRSRVRF